MPIWHMTSIKPVSNPIFTLAVNSVVLFDCSAFVVPLGYAFLLFKEESSVLSLLHACFSEEDKYFIYIPSGTQTKKKVEVLYVIM